MILLMLWVVICLLKIVYFRIFVVMVNSGRLMKLIGNIKGIFYLINNFSSFREYNFLNFFFVLRFLCVCNGGFLLVLI